MTDRKPLSLISGQIKSVSSGDQLTVGGISASGSISLSSGSSFTVDTSSGGNASFQFGINGSISTLSAVGAGGLLIDATTNDMSINVGGELTLKNSGSTLFSISGDSSTGSLTGVGTTSTVISAGVHPLQLVGSRVDIFDGATSVLQIEDLINISLLSGKGSSGTELNSTTSNLTFRAPSGSQIKLYENTDNVWNFEYDTANTAGKMSTPATVGWIEAPILYCKASSSGRFVDPNGLITYYWDTNGPVIGDSIHGYAKITTANTGYIWNSWGATANTLHNTKEYWGSVQTTNATQTTGLSITLPNGAAGFMAKVVASDSTGDFMADFIIKSAYRIKAGAATLVSTSTETLGTDDAAYSVTSDASGATGRILVTGKAATNLRWEIYSLVWFGGYYV